MAWVRENCQEGLDKNPEYARHTREQKDENWSFTVEMRPDYQGPDERKSRFRGAVV